MQFFREFTPLPLTSRMPYVPHLSHEMSRLMAAAVVSPRFRKTLLLDPEVALRTNYSGESFLLTAKERETLASFRTNDLPSLANMLLRIRYFSFSPVKPPNKKK